MPKTAWWEHLDAVLGRINEFTARFRWFGYLISVAMFAFLIWIVWRDWHSLGDIDLGTFRNAILGSFFLYPLSFAPQVAVWIRLVGQRQPLWKDVEIYVYTHLMRRLPGGVWHWAGRALLYHETTGVSSQVTLKASMLEWVLLLAASATSYGLSRLLNSSVPLGLTLTVLPLIVGGLLVGRGKRFVTGVIYVLLYCTAWLIGGGIVFWLARSSPLSSLSLSSAIGVWAAAGGISLATIIFPAGLGVRELSLVFFLRPYMPVSSAVTIAILLRVIFVVGDLCWGGLAMALARKLSPAGPMPGS